jgi:ribosome-associated heat shock protein Hsp15
VNGERPNKARWIRLGEEVRIRKGPFEFHVVVTRLSGERGPAQEARALYRETAESVQARALLALRLRSQPRVRYTGKGRPTKRDRRAIDRLEQADHDR